MNDMIFLEVVDALADNSGASYQQTQLDYDLVNYVTQSPLMGFELVLGALLLSFLVGYIMNKFIEWVGKL